jgi:hypothetical protein
LVLLWRYGRLSGRRLATAVVIMVVVPAVVGYREASRFRTQEKDPWDIQRPSMDLLFNASVNLRTLVFPRSADRDIFRAWPYDLFADGEFALLKDNTHGLPALLHLGIFTDILNVYQYDPYDSYFGQRTISHHRLMQAAVKTGVLWSLLAILGTAVVLIASCVAFVRRREMNLDAFVLLVAGTAWFVNIVAVFPFIVGAYYSGFWLPRLVAPALLVFFILGFVLVDRFVPSKAHVVFFVLAIGQSLLHIAFLWPSISQGPLLEPNRDLYASKLPAILRVMDWVDQYNENRTGPYWLDKTVGIVINRPMNSSSEPWSLHMTLAAGPVATGMPKRVKLSQQGVEARFVEFVESKDVSMEVPLAAGRNDVAVELLSPNVVNTSVDPVSRIAVISHVELISPTGAVTPVGFPPRTNP